jgi:hypothetical protein
MMRLNPGLGAGLEKGFKTTVSETFDHDDNVNSCYTLCKKIIVT